jgi:hypothetical protein
MRMKHQLLLEILEFEARKPAAGAARAWWRTLATIRASIPG